MARKARRAARKQRITLRFKRREQVKHHLRTVIVRSAAVALVLGFGAGLVTGGDSFLSRFLERHTPQVAVNSPQTLAGIPVLADLPKHRILLWLPGSGYWLQRRAVHEYAAVRALWIERLFASNRIIVHLEPRLPLVTCRGAGFDRDGVLFAITPGTWKALPQAVFLPTARKPELGRWLEGLSTMTALWSQVVEIRQDNSESLELTLKTGAAIMWGPAEQETLARKGQTLLRVLDDGHKNMGGIARADLRFFDQGRIIVRAKSAH